MARFRPQNEQERAQQGSICCDFEEDGRAVNVNVKGLKEYRGDKDSYRFTFDRVFSPNASQGDVYEATTRQLVADVLDGYYATVINHPGAPWSPTAANLPVF